MTLKDLYEELSGTLDEARKKKPQFFPDDVVKELDKVITGFPGVEFPPRWREGSSSGLYDKKLWTDVIYNEARAKANSSIDDFARAIARVVTPLLGVTDHGYHYGKGFNFGQLKYGWSNKWGKQRFGVDIFAYENRSGNRRHEIQIHVGGSKKKGR